MSIMKKSLFGVAVAMAALGCSSNPKFAPEPTVDAGAPPPPPPVIDAGPPQPGPCEPPQLLAITTTMKARAAAEAPGMQAQGDAICGVVPEGQTISSLTFTVEQGYCYTFLGQSLPPVTEVDIQLEADVSTLPPAIAAVVPKVLLVDELSGEKASMGSKQNCYQWLLPVPAQVKLITKARAGTGPVAAQVYRKKKF